MRRNILMPIAYILFLVVFVCGSYLLLELQSAPDRHEGKWDWLFKAFFFKGAPDLHQAEWKSLSVEYMVLEGTNYVKKGWSTTDRAILDRLSKSLNVKDADDLWGMGTMTTNKITLELANGKRFILYVNKPTRLCMNEFPNPPTGFGLDVTRDFHDELKSIIEAQTGAKVYFYPPREYQE